MQYLWLQQEVLQSSIRSGLRKEVKESLILFSRFAFLNLNIHVVLMFQHFDVSRVQFKLSTDAAFLVEKEKSLILVELAWLWEVYGSSTY